MAKVTGSAEPTNSWHAECAMTGVEAFACEIGENYHGDGLRVVIGELLADLMHLCEIRGINFEAALAAGCARFESETGAEQSLREEDLLALGYSIIEDPDRPMWWCWVCEHRGSRTSFPERKEAVADAVANALEEYELHRCDNCGKVHSEQTLVSPIKDLHQRVAPGGVMPSGECADCGCLCYPINPS